MEQLELTFHSDIYQKSLCNEKHGFVLTLSKPLPLFTPLFVSCVRLVARCTKLRPLKPSHPLRVRSLTI